MSSCDFELSEGFAEVGKRNQGKIFRGRGNAEAEKCFSRFFLFLFYLGEKLKSQENNFFPKAGKGKISETECFFHFLWLFHNDSSISSNESIVNSVE